MTEKEVLEKIEEAAREGWAKLDLSSKGIKSLPGEIGKLTNLTVLYLRGNRLASVPAKLGNLTNLTGLYLSGNQLTSVPAELGKLTNLTVLYLVGNQLTSVPAELGNLSKLTRLDLTYNQLTSVPAELGKLTNLEALLLYENQLRSVPAELGKLTKLTRLWVHENQLRSVPAELGKLTSVRELWLNNNQLTSVPAELGNLTNLTWLTLGGNRLTRVPAELGKLSNLTELYLQNNQLTSVLAELGGLSKLRELRLEGNPLESPPGEVVEQGTAAVLAYLRELGKGAKKRYEAKLLLLGDGGEGKTCVSRGLRGLKFKKQVRTAGVEVKPWRFENAKHPGEKDKEITLNIWDFEGQEINHQSHQFFLTEQSLYVLVINGRREFKLRRAEYWLDTIRSRAPESRVILVASECENTTPSWPLDKLKANYGDLLRGENWYFVVGCESGKGIEELSEEIKRGAADMKQMGQDWPESYQRAEDAIRERAKKAAQVRRTELYEIFRESGISEEGFGNAAEQMATLGVITQFRDSPELADFVVLNPQWLTKGISLVMEDEQLDRDKGEITHERMSQIWEKDYKGLYAVFHSCMKEFELCYDLEEKAGCLVPLRFGSAVPDIPWSEIPGAKERRVEYKLNIRPPKGIMSRFIVKTHYMIAKTKEMPKGVYWLNGVFLRSGEGEYRSEALCEFDEGERTLRIEVGAAFPQNMIEQLHGFVKAVFSFFEGLRSARSYGCVKFEEKTEAECEGNHSERRIFSALMKDRVIDCEYGWHDVDPKRLVYGFSSFGKMIVASEEQMTAMVKEGVKQIENDVMSVLVNVDKVSTKVDEIKEQARQLPAKIGQEVELRLRDYLGLFDEMLDNRDFNSAPAVVSICPVDGSAFNPVNWFNKGYILTPYCEYEGGVHKVDFGVKFKKPRVWWEKTAPKLAFGMKVLSAGIKIACAGLPLAIDAKIFEEIKNEVAFMKELAGHLELEGGAESEILEEGGEVVEDLRSPVGKQRSRRSGMTDRSGGRGVYDVRGEDEKRIVRMQLAELFSELAPGNYKARQWGELRRLRMADNTYRWLCEGHAVEYRK